MRACIIVLSLFAACLLTAIAVAQPVKKLSSLDRFTAMDTNHDGIVTVQEFVAAHPKMDAEKAAAHYANLASLGGVTRRHDMAGMTYVQFRKAHKLWKESHPPQRAN